MLAPLADGGVRLHASHAAPPPAPAPAPASCTPVIPPSQSPGAHAGKAPPGPNHFHFSIAGPDPDLAVGGTHDQQEHQRDETVRLAGYAAGSYESRLLPGSARWPSDAQVTHILDGLQPNPPIGADGDKVTHAVYQSQVPNASGKDVFQHWVDHPNEVFNAGGMEIRPPITALKDGRYMLETAGTKAPPTWLPVQIKVDEAQQQIHIQTLDGHVLRGEQTFSFRDDGCGGATITQDARFQAGSKLVGDMQKFLPISTGQHNAWQQAHRESYEQFNGDRDYQGMGIPYVDPLGQMAALGVTAASQVFHDPGRAADAGIDLTGDAANLGFDLAGRIDAWAADKAGAVAHGVLDTLHLPGGDAAQQTLHDTGQVLNTVADKTGDVLEAGADKAGDVAKKVVDFLF